MKRVTVTWMSVELDRLTEIWIAALDPMAVTHASDWFDIVLSTNPEIGTREGDTYRLSQGPLEILYTYSPDDCLVTVIKVTYKPFPRNGQIKG